MKIGRIEVLRVITVSLAFLLWHGAKNILDSLIVPSLIAILIILFFGRFFCGWVCPTGMLLEYSHILTERKEKKGIVYGTLWRDRKKYAILLALLAAILLFRFTASHLFSSPGIFYGTVIHFTTHGIVLADLTVLPLIFILNVFALRFGRTWCNTLCPLGTIISILSIVNLVKPKVDQETCIDFDFNCLNCERICPMRIPVTRADRWAMMDCNGCLKCWENCPVKAIKIKVFDYGYPSFFAKKSAGKPSGKPER